MDVAHNVKLPVYPALSLVVDLGFSVEKATAHLQRLMPAVSPSICFKHLPIVLPPRAWRLLRRCNLDFLS